VLPTLDGYLQADFTDLEDPQEVAWADLESSLGKADSWSTYWYNNVIYANGGLNRREPAGNRGFEAYAVHDEYGARLRLRRWRWLNPQTQETWQVPR
jgi:hypothetical protein